MPTLTHLFPLPVPLRGWWVALLAALAVVACSDDGGNGNGSGEIGTDVTGDAPSEVTPDVAGDPATDGRNCTPGASRCLSDRRAEVCGESSVWAVVDCTESQLCWGGECGELGTCEPESVESCVSHTRYQGCNPVGTGRGEFEVPFNLTCLDDEGGARLEPRLCLQGEARCENEQVLERCADSGLTWEFSTNCQQQDATTLCDEGRCIPLCQFIEKLKTYVGCEYWAVDLDNYIEGRSDAFNAQFAVAVTNPSAELTANVTVESATRVLVDGRVFPESMLVLRLPPAHITGTMVGAEAYRITSDIPIVAYQFNPLENVGAFSNDASILFPTSSLGTDYWVMTLPQLVSDTSSALTVVATQQGSTQVTIHLPEFSLANPVTTRAGSGIPALRGGDSYTHTLQQFEVLNLETNRGGADLTGTRIEATRPVAVFGNAEIANAPQTHACVERSRRCQLNSECGNGNCVGGRCENDWVCAWDRQTSCWDTGLRQPSVDICYLPFRTCCADHIEQQMLPVHAWGRHFYATRSWPRCSSTWPHVCQGGRQKGQPCPTQGVQACRLEGDVWRIMAGAENTEIRLIGIADDEPQPGPGSDFLYEPVVREWTGSRALQPGQTIEFVSWSDFEIRATGPIFVGQFLTGLHTPGENPPPADDPMNGDPAFIMAIPSEQYRSDYIFLVPGEYAHNFVTVDAPLGTTVTHDDGSRVEEWGPELFTPFGEGQFGVYRVELMREGFHRLTADVPFGVVVHGYDDDVSYGYPAGLDLREISR
jgi:hypothetical protein